MYSVGVTDAIIIIVYARSVIIVYPHSSVLSFCIADKHSHTHTRALIYLHVLMYLWNIHAHLFDIALDWNMKEIRKKFIRPIQWNNIKSTSIKKSVASNETMSKSVQKFGSESLTAISEKYWEWKHDNKNNAVYWCLPIIYKNCLCSTWKTIPSKLPLNALQS